jgi:hypothetical protein
MREHQPSWRRKSCGLIKSDRRPETVGSSFPPSINPVTSERIACRRAWPTRRSVMNLHRNWASVSCWSVRSDACPSVSSRGMVPYELMNRFGSSRRLSTAFISWPRSQESMIEAGLWEPRFMAGRQASILAEIPVLTRWDVQRGVSNNENVLFRPNV